MKKKLRIGASTSGSARLGSGGRRRSLDMVESARADEWTELATLFVNGSRVSETVTASEFRDDDNNRL